MAASRLLEHVIDIARCVIRESDALFGYVFELTPDAKGISRGLPVLGRIRDEEVLRAYFKSFGERALDLVAKNEDQAVPVGAPEDAEGHSWFAVFLSQDMGVPACVVIVYSFYDRDEAVRTLRLIEMIMTIRPLA